MSTCVIRAFPFAILIAICGCVPTRQLYNAPSEHYKESGQFNNALLDHNKTQGVLVALETGYVSPRDPNHLSIYLTYHSEGPVELSVVGGGILGNNASPLELVQFGSGLQEPQSQIHSGDIYYHFKGEGLSKFIEKPGLVLEIQLKINGSLSNLRIPLLVKTIWVWPT